jgi:hypothetical protein
MTTKVYSLITLKLPFLKKLCNNYAEETLKFIFYYDYSLFDSLESQT